MSQEVIIKAIKDRNLLKFSHKGSFKVVEPHLLGENKHHKICLSAFQVKTYAKSGVIIPWREYLLDEITELEILPDVFAGPRPHYEPTPNRRFATAIAQL